MTWCQVFEVEEVSPWVSLGSSSISFLVSGATVLKPSQTCAFPPSHTCVGSHGTGCFLVKGFCFLTSLPASELIHLPLSPGKDWAKQGCGSPGTVGSGSTHPEETCLPELFL